MKMTLILITLLTSLAVFAGETATECPMMRDSNNRSNPKINLAQTKNKQAKGKASSQ